MNRGTSPRAVAMLIIVVWALLLAGCESEPAASDEAVKEAGQAHVEAMAEEHAEDTTESSPAADVAPVRSVISQMMAYTVYNDELVYGYFSAPGDMFEPLPAVIMIHEWWGLNDNIKAMADRLAGERYIVFAVDLYNGKLANTPGAAQVLMMKSVGEPEAARENIRAAFTFVSETAGGSTACQKTF